MEAFPGRVRENTLDWEVARKQMMLREASLWSSVLQVEECRGAKWWPEQLRFLGVCLCGLLWRDNLMTKIFRFSDRLGNLWRCCPVHCREASASSAVDFDFVDSEAGAVLVKNKLERVGEPTLQINRNLAEASPLSIATMNRRPS